jgi:lipopolysaccharide heptosyltransferase II
MKSLQILPSLEVGGVERGVVDLARAMKKRGEEVVVISAGGPLVAELQKIGVTHYALPVDRKSIFSLSLVSRIAEIIEKEHIDIVHARSRVPAWLAWLAARRTHRTFVTTCHGYYSLHLLSRIMGWGKRVIVISTVIGRHMIDDFGVSPERIRLVHRGVDLSQFSPKASASRDGVMRIINIGRLSPIKGQVEFLKAVHEVRRHIPSMEVMLVGSEHSSKHKYTDLIHKTIRQLNLESCVKLMGTRRDIPELLAQADLLVLPTLVPEAFGRVIIEAGAVGTPVIATALGGVLDIIEPGHNGMLVTPGDIKGMSEAMVTVLKDKNLAQKLAANLREKVNKQFSLDTMTEATLKVYREASAEKKILVIKLGALGDLILAVPSFRMLRKRFPFARISVVVDRKLAALISKSPYIDEIIPVDRAKLSKLSYLLKTARRLRREGFDISVDLQNSKWTHLLSFLSGILERYGFSRGAFRFLLNRPDHTFETTDAPVRHQYRILSKIGVREFNEELELWSDPESEARAKALLGNAHAVKRVGLVIGSSPKWPTKRWPLESFLELSRRIGRELKCQTVLIGSEQDGVSAESFENEEGVINLIGKTTLSDLVPVIRGLDVLVTGDTAPLHIAAAAQTPVVALFGPTDPKRHMPPAKYSSVLVKNLACQPCYQGTCANADSMACLKQISVQEVFQAVQRQLFKKSTPVSV